jgi:hypothetical protein
VYEIPAAGGYTTVNSLASGLVPNPTSIAVDGNENVFVVSGSVVQEILAAGGYTKVNALPNNSYPPTAVAVDGSGDVLYSSYYAWYDGSRSALNEIPAGCVVSTCVKTLDSNSGYFNGLAVDGSGNVFATNGQGLVKLDFADAPSLTFATPTAVGSTDTSDPPQTVTAQNIGNAPLTFQPFVYSNLLDAILPSLHATDCTELSGLQLTPGTACTLEIEFQPQLSGPVSGHVNLVDNSLNVYDSTQSILVFGNGGSIPPPTGVTVSPQSLTFLSQTWRSIRLLPAETSAR